MTRLKFVFLLGTAMIAITALIIPTSASIPAFIERDKVSGYLFRIHGHPTSLQPLGVADVTYKNLSPNNQYIKLIYQVNTGPTSEWTNYGNPVLPGQEVPYQIWCDVGSIVTFSLEVDLVPQPDITGVDIIVPP